MPCSARRRLASAHCSADGVVARHIRGLELNICSVLQPNRYARSTAFATPPFVDVWIPMRSRVSLCGVFCAGQFRTSKSPSAERPGEGLAILVVGFGFEIFAEEVFLGGMGWSDDDNIIIVPLDSCRP